MSLVIIEIKKLFVREHQDQNARLEICGIETSVWKVLRTKTCDGNSLKSETPLIANYTRPSESKLRNHRNLVKKLSKHLNKSLVII